MTKTRTRTATRTATAVALGTVGLASIAAAALAFNFRDTNAVISRSLNAPTLPTAPSGSGTRAPVAVDAGTTVNIPRPTVGTVPTGTAVTRMTNPSCRSNPKDYPDLTLGTGVVTRVGFGTTRGAVLIQILNNTDKQAGAFSLHCIEELSGGRLQDLGFFEQPFLEGRRQRTQSVEYSPTAIKVQCFVDAREQVEETNECNNVKDFSVEAPI